MSKQLRTWLRDVVLFPLVKDPSGQTDVALPDVLPGTAMRPLVGGGKAASMLSALKTDAALVSAMQSGNLIGRILWAIGQ